MLLSMFPFESSVFCSRLNLLEDSYWWILSHKLLWQPHSLSQYYFSLLNDTELMVARFVSQIQTIQTVWFALYVKIEVFYESCTLTRWSHVLCLSKYFAGQQHGSIALLWEYKAKLDLKQSTKQLKCPVIRERYLLWKVILYIYFKKIYSHPF